MNIQLNKKYRIKHENCNVLLTEVIHGGYSGIVKDSNDYRENEEVCVTIDELEEIE